MPIVSIILTVYNNKTDILTAIDSVFVQTFTDWELIIVDDGSTDGLIDVIKDVVKNEKIIFIQNEKNLGRYISLNMAINVAKGKYIALIDSDDIYYPEKTQRQVNVLDKNPKIVCVRTMCNKGNVLKGIAPATIMFRSNIISKIGYFDSVRFGADSEFYYRIIKTYGKAATLNIKTVLYFAKIRYDSLTMMAIPNSRSVRGDYKKNYRKWHNDTNILYMPFPLESRPFAVNPIMLKN